MPGNDRMVVHVTATNHEWAAEMTGYSLEEIKQRYKDAAGRQEVCVVTAKPGLYLIKEADLLYVSLDAEPNAFGESIEVLGSDGEENDDPDQ